jgi:hypothetical protein
MAILIGAPPRWRMTSTRLVCTVLACMMLGPTLSAQSQSVSTEANIKAVYLFNFSKYVTWPGLMGERSPAELRICVPANDSFFATLKTAVEGEDVDGKPLEAVALDGLDAAKTCQILFVGHSQTADARAWLSAVRNSQVLTVAEGPLADGIVIAFVRDDNRIRFDISREAAARRGLNISSKLLRLARQVRD